MAEDKKTIVIYSDWIKKFEALEDDEAGRLIKHLFRYVNDLNPVPPDRITALSFIDIENTLKRDLVKWEKRAERSRENGKLGGRPLTQKNLTKPKETHQVILEPGKPDSVNDNVSVNEINNNRSKKFDQFNFSREFELFWSKYPNKVGKKDTQKKFSRLKEDQVKKILSTIDAFINYKPFEAYTYPNPQTYINQERWNDELPEKKKFEHGYTPQMPN